jgi:DNA-binding LacI/PurR family transcriptional regulator
MYERLFAKSPFPDCVMCANDILAIGFMNAAIGVEENYETD